MGTSRKKQNTQHHSNRSSLGKAEAILFPIIIVILLAYFIIAKSNGDETIDENYLIASIAVCIVLMVVSMPGMASGGGKGHRKAPRPRKASPSGKKAPKKKAPPKPGKGAVIAEVDEDEIIKKERKIISYPSAASGGKYGDAYIPISPEMILKVRSLLAVSCKNCKDIDSCWEKYQGMMDYDKFLESTECYEKMDADVLSAAPPIQVTADEAVEETVVVAEEEPVVEEEWGSDDGFVDETPAVVTTEGEDGITVESETDNEGDWGDEDQGTAEDSFDDEDDMAWE